MAALGLGVVLSGCEPASLTEARDQLSRGPARVVEYQVPVAQDTFSVGDALDSLGLALDTLPDSLLAVSADPVFLSVSGLTPVPIVNLPVDTTVTPPPVWQSADSAGLNLSDFADAIRDATLNSALAEITVSNSADAPLTLINFTLGLVQVTGGSLDSAAGALAYEQDGMGNPILVDVVDNPGDTTYAIARSEAGKIDTVQSAALVGRLVDLLLNSDTVALVGAGDVRIGDGTPITILPTDQLSLQIVPIIGFDLTLPAAGIGFDLPNITESGLDLDAELADDIAALADSAGVTLAVENSTGFELEVQLAVVRGVVTGDVFTTPGAVVNTLRVDAALVDGTGRVTGPVSDTTTAALVGAEIRELFDPQFTAGLRVRLLPPIGGRGALRIVDQLSVDASASVWISVGGGTP